MTMPGRKYSAPSTSYRYGFNGKEDDNTTGEGNLDFGARIYDSRLGRWLSTDPKTTKYASWSPYNFTIDNPINVIDPDGKDIILLTWVTTKGDPGHTAIAVRDYGDVKMMMKGKLVTFHHQPLNTYTVYELGPKGKIPRDETAFTQPFTPNYEPKVGVTYDEIMKNRTENFGTSISKYDGFLSEGILRILTDGYKDDIKIKEMLEGKNKRNEKYKTLTNNCTSYCADVIPTYNDNKIDANETIVWGDGTKVVMQSPIKLYVEVEKKVNKRKLIHVRVIAAELIKDLKTAYETNPKRGEVPKK